MCVDVVNCISGLGFPFKDFSPFLSSLLSLPIPLFLSSCQRLDSASPSSRAHVKTELLSPRSKSSRHGARSPRSTSPEKGGRCSGVDKHSHRRRSRSTSMHKHKGRSKAKPSAQKESPRSLSNTGYSSDSEGSACSHPYHVMPGVEKNHGAHAKK